jgi:hypothetical protein
LFAAKCSRREQKTTPLLVWEAGRADSTSASMMGNVITRTRKATAGMRFSAIFLRGDATGNISRYDHAKQSIYPFLFDTDVDAVIVLPPTRFFTWID